jgi:hypothetical protein
MDMKKKTKKTTCMGFMPRLKRARAHLSTIYGDGRQSPNSTETSIREGGKEKGKERDGRPQGGQSYL